MTLDEFVADPDNGHEWLTVCCGIAPDEAARLVGVIAEEHAELQPPDRPTPPGPVGNRPRRSDGHAAPGLTPTELEAVALIVDGHTAKQIAARLGIHDSNVSRRLAGAGKKLGTNTTAQTAVEAVRRGLLGPDTQRAHRIRREVAERHASTCALLRSPVCDCGATPGEAS